MKVIWEVEDDFEEKFSRQTTVISDDDFLDRDGEPCENKEERQQIINQAVQNDFDQNITWAIVRIEK